MSKLIKVFLTVISVIALGYVVFVMQKPNIPKEEIKIDGQNENNNAANIQPETNTPESNNNRAPIDENNGKGIDTSDWKTYRNEQYGFEIKYPKEFSSWEANYSQQNAEKIDVGFRPEDLQGSVLVITVLDKPLQELSTYEHSLYGNPTNETIKIGDLTGVKFSGYRPRMIGIQKGNYTFFFLALNWRNEKDLEYFDQMLSTFKFDEL